MDFDTMSLLLQQAIVSGLVTGSAYALLAISAVVAFKTTDVVNFALGGMFMTAGYLGLYLTLLAHWPFVTAVLAVLLACIVGGALFYRGALRPIERRGGTVITLVIACLGLEYVLKGGIRFSALSNEPKSFPTIFGSDVISIGNVVISYQDMAVVTIAIASMLILFLLYEYTKTGRAMRAATMNPKAATLVGIDLVRMRMYGWGISVFLVGVAVILIAPSTFLSPDMGIIAMMAFAAAVVGGFTSLTGAVIGGFIIGIVQNVVGLLVSSNAIVVTPFAVIMIVLLVRPQGLFGQNLASKKL